MKKKLKSCLRILLIKGEICLLPEFKRLFGHGEKIIHFVKWHHIGSVTFGIGRIWMSFDKETINTYGACSTT